MDPLVQRLVIAQDLIAQVLTFVPPAAHAAVQTALDGAKAKLDALSAQAAAQPPLVVPQLVPLGATP